MADSNAWVFDLESVIFSRVKYKALAALKEKYPDIRFTTTDKPVDSTTVYPTVYIHELSGAERGRDLDGDTINALLYSMQIEVITNTSQKDAKRVMEVLAESYKEMRFEIYALPAFENGNTYYRSVMRVRRMVGAGDTF